MDAGAFKERLKQHGITLKKVRGHPLHQIMVDGLHHSYHPSRAVAKKELVGGGFFKDFKRGFSSVFNPALKLAKNVVVPLAKMYNPSMGESAEQAVNLGDRVSKVVGGRRTLMY
jgi:hypothetical protein